MRITSASEAKQNFAALLDAAQHEPVLIRRHDRDVAVLISALDYEKMQQAKISEPAPVSEPAGGRQAVVSMSEQLLAELNADESSNETGR